MTAIRDRIGVIVGSNRRESINRKLAEAAIRLAPGTLEFVWIRIDDLPMYNGDLEPSRPDCVHRMTQQVREVDGLFVVTPEHNRSVPAVLKNAIDWGSKPMESNVWRNKAIAMTGASPGVYGTAVGQQHLRQILAVLGALVLGGEAYIQFKADLLDEAGAIVNENIRQMFLGYWERFGELVIRMDQRTR